MLKFIIYNIYIENLLFFTFSSILIISALLIIIVRNSIYSVLFLVLNFIAASGILFLLECEFISLLFLIIYVGAIAVLFLFVIMMLDIKFLELPKDVSKYFPVGIIIGSIFLLEVFLVMLSTFKPNPYHTSEYGVSFINFYTNWYCKIDVMPDIKALGQVLYTHYILQLLITGLILLLAVIGSVVLTITNSSIKSKKQIFFKQISRNYKNILLI
jgi:NADH-quinone oxidoreductase subunit J